MRWWPTLFVLLAACGGSDSTGPDPRFNGDWTAPSAGQYFDNVHVTIYFASAQHGVGGSWSMHTVGCTLPSCDQGGFVLDGTLNGNQITIPFTRSGTGCTETMGVVSATLTSANTLSGTFVRTVCGGQNDPPAPIMLTHQ